MPLSNIDVTNVKKQVIRTINHLSDKVWIVTVLGVIMSLVISACTSMPFVPTPEIINPNDPVSVVTAELPAPTLVESEPMITRTVEEMPPPATAEEIERLHEEIDAKIQLAIENADPVQKILFEMSQRAEAVAEMFAVNLTNPENPADRILDPDSFSIGLTPDGIAYLKLEVDSFWGKTGEVAIIDMGDDKGKFVSLTGVGIQNCTLAFDEKGYYAVARDEADTIVAAIDSSRQWIKKLDQSKKLPEVDVSKQMAEAYLNGTIDYPNDLTDEQKATFESALASVEADLSYEQQKKLIEDRFEIGSKAFEALIKEDGNLEYYDGSWHTIEKMVTPEGYIIPWGEMYFTLDENDNEPLMKIFDNNEETIASFEKILNQTKGLVFSNGTGDPEKAGFLFAQAVPSNSSEWKSTILGKKQAYFEIDFLLIIRNGNKINVVNTTFYRSGNIWILNVSSKKATSTNLYDLKHSENMSLNTGLIGIPSEIALTTMYPKDMSDYNEDEKEFVDARAKSTAEKFMENPIKIEDLTLTFLDYIQ